MSQNSIDNERISASEFVQEILSDFQRAWGGRVLLRDERLRRAKAKNAKSVPFEKGRDPKKVSTIFNHLVKSEGWELEIAQAAILNNWHEIVGVNTASHTRIAGIENSTLIVICDSTAWATELRRLKPIFIKKLAEKYPEAKIFDIKIEGIKRPNFTHGAWRVQGGRGVRDTYG